VRSETVLLQTGRPDEDGGVGVEQEGWDLALGRRTRTGDPGGMLSVGVFRQDRRQPWQEWAENMAG
jgi:hypothetical protein